MNLQRRAKMDCIQDTCEGCPGASIEKGRPHWVSQNEANEYLKAYAAQQFAIDTANGSLSHRGWKFDKERASPSWEMFDAKVRTLTSGQIYGELHGLEGPLYTIWETEGEYLVWSVMES